MSTSNLIETGALKKLMGVASNEAMLSVNEDVQYLYDTLAPTISVKKASGDAYVLEVNDALGYQNDLITPRSVPNEVGGEYRKTTYSTDEYAIRMMVTEKDIEVYGSRTMLVQQATRTVTSTLRGNMELRFFNTFFNKNAGWKTTFDGQDDPSNIETGKIQYWNNDASDPIKDIDAMKEKNAKYLGNTKLNRAVIAKDVWNALKNHPDIAPRLQGSSKDIKLDRALQAEFAKLIEVERVDIIDYMSGVHIDKIRDITLDSTPEKTYTRQLKGVFMLYRYEDARTLQNKAAFNIIDVPSNMVSFNRGIPKLEMYPHHDRGVRAFWVDGRIGAGLHLSNPAGLVFCEKMLKNA